MKRIGIIGFGFMGSSVARALLTREPLTELGVVEKDPARREAASRDMGAQDFSHDPRGLWGWADVIVLAVKPQELRLVSEAVRTTERSAGEELNDRPIVSILAGTPIATVSTAFQTDQVIRMMPNLAADIGKAVVGVAFASTVRSAIRESFLALFSGLGTLLEVPEERIAAITGISGSGIAFTFRFIHALALGGVHQGLPYQQSLTAARDVVESAALLLRESEIHPEEMVSRVCSPGGTTIEGIRALAAGAMEDAVISAVAAAACRSRELEG
jgi:pyrroline-5-carboxylate reductase